MEAINAFLWLLEGFKKDLSATELLDPLSGYNIQHETYQSLHSFFTIYAADGSL